jgi:hypothetical protein
MARITLLSIQPGKAAALPPENQIRVVQGVAIDHQVGLGLRGNALTQSVKIFQISQILHHSQEDVFPAFLKISLPRPELKVRANRGKSTEVDWKTQVVDRQSV